MSKDQGSWGQESYRRGSWGRGVGVGRFGQVGVRRVESCWGRGGYRVRRVGVRRSCRGSWGQAQLP